MKLILEIEGRPPRETTLAELAEGASIEEVGPGLYSIIRAGRSYQARVTGSRVEVAGRSYDISIRDPRALVRHANDAGGAGRQSVKAPMPGKVVRVLVAIGDTVESGQGLIVVEAMKMQNELKSPKAGTVVQLTAETGATVGAGEVLAVVE
jgi:biotin carboxyl carrier protein